MLAIFALTAAIVFLVLWRFGLLDELSNLFGDAPSRSKDPEEERRLEVFRDFFGGENEAED